MSLTERCKKVTAAIDDNAGHPALQQGSMQDARFIKEHTRNRMFC